MLLVWRDSGLGCRALGIQGLGVEGLGLGFGV